MSVQNSLQVALIQMDCQPKACIRNRDKAIEELEKLPDSTDVAVLPELFNVGYVLSNATMYETMNSELLFLLKHAAKKKDMAIACSLIIRERDLYFNRFLWITPDSIQFYDKRHLFTHSGEDKHFRAGKERLFVQWKGWRICPVICYDIRFPVWCRQPEELYDMLLVVANWPAARISIWEILLQTRAIENQVYVLACNRVGKDIEDTVYGGRSVVFDAFGKSPLRLDDTEQTATVELAYQTLLTQRERFPVLPDRDSFTIR